MKKLILFLCIALPLSAMSQLLDTIRVRHLTQQAQDWALLVAMNVGNQNTDSLSIATFRKMRSVVQAVQNPQWTTNITIDSIPGKIVLEFYMRAKQASAGQVATRYTTITNAISAKAVLSYWIGRIDESFARDYEDTRNKGKNLLLDQ